MTVIATAGHVDHGKSTLVLRLTGTDPDRWEEEKSRGLTIDLGFAYCDFEGRRLGFIDVPGHRRGQAQRVPPQRVEIRQVARRPGERQQDHRESDGGLDGAHGRTRVPISGGRCGKVRPRR